MDPDSRIIALKGLNANARPMYTTGLFSRRRMHGQIFVSADLFHIAIMITVYMTVTFPFAYNHRQYRPASQSVKIYST